MTAPTVARAEPPAPTNSTYEAMMKRPRRAAAADPSLSVHQHFAKADPQLFQKAKRPPKEGTPHDQLMPIEENEDEPDEGDTDVELDDEDDAIGPGPDCDAVSHDDRADGYLRPRAYGRNGANVATNPTPAVVGRSSGSYDPRARPASARVPRSSVGVGKAEKLERRVRKYMAARPGASRVEATAWAERPKKVRKVLLKGAA